MEFELSFWMKLIKSKKFRFGSVGFCTRRTMMVGREVLKKGKKEKEKIIRKNKRCIENPIHLVSLLESQSLNI